MTKRMVIGLSGPIGCGKTTAARAIINIAPFQRVRFAGPLKAMAAALGLTTEQVDGALKETPCALLCGHTPRHAMQTLGTEWGRGCIGNDVWVNAWSAAVEQVDPACHVVADDVRFANEAEAIRRAGGKVIRITRPGTGGNGHASEKFDFEPDIYLANTGDETDFRASVLSLVNTLHQDWINQTWAEAGTR